MISYFSDEVALRGLRVQSVFSIAGKFLRFLDWADRSNYFDALINRAAAYSAFREYIAYLRECVNKGELGVNSGAANQNAVLAILSEIMSLEDVHVGVNLLRKDSKSEEHAEPPCDEAQGEILALCNAIFSGISELVLEHKAFPFRLAMPKYLGWAEPGLWVFPTIRWHMAPHDLAQREKLSGPYWAYDYENGCIARPEAIAHRYSHPIKRPSVMAVEAAAAGIIDANLDRRNAFRIRLAGVAHNAFVLIFLANTGLNAATICELPWGESFTVDGARQGFRAIKWRAGGRVVSIEIQIVLLPMFRRFLKLREYLLNGVAYDRLFLSFGRNRQSAPKPISPGFLDGFFKTLRSIDPNLQKVMPRRWRAGKSDWYLRQTDLTTASEALQNSEQTVKRHYTAGSPTASMEEMSNYYAVVSDAVRKSAILESNEVVANTLTGPVGCCTAFGSPQQVSEKVPAEPNCKRPEGCLFCDKYRVHADERDARKLISCQYCLVRLMSKSGEVEHFEAILERIEELLAEISKKEGNEEMVSRVSREVNEDGEMDPYWARKLELLLSLDLVL